MIEGEIARPSPGETITCIRSAQAGGPFIFELELAPGAGRPPVHTHDEGDETIEVLSGEMVFLVCGKTKLLRAGDTITLSPHEPHTFWNPSKREPMKARVVHGARFERLIAQPNLLCMLMYLVDVDPGSSRATSPWMRWFAHMGAWVGRLLGKTPIVSVG
jgi:quercetin dioxygenase-like cupin family protein